MKQEEQLLVGWKEISGYLRLSERTLRNYRGHLLSERIIFYRRAKRGNRKVCAWPHDVREWSKNTAS